jgi:hypothetical protein
MKYLYILCFLLSTASQALCQTKNELTTDHVKSRYFIQTIVGPKTNRIDTINFEEFSTDQKITIYKSYSHNKVNYYSSDTFDQKRQTRTMTTVSDGILSNREEFFYDVKGNIIQSIVHRYAKSATGDVKEVTTDTARETFDKAGNRLSREDRSSRKTFVYGKHNQLIESNFYMQRSSPKAQKDVFVYNGNLLMETLSYWYDGKLYHRVTNQYNDQKQLTDSRDSTTGWLQLLHYAYNKKGLKETVSGEKTFRNDHAKTVTEYTYSDKGQMITQLFRSNDPLLTQVFAFKYLLKAPDYELKETYSYDQYGNRLKITTELNGIPVKIVYFLMTYYK